jgi:hypothetical protein
MMRRASFAVILAGSLFVTAATRVSVAQSPASVAHSTSPAKATALRADPKLAAWEYVAGTPADIAQVAKLEDGVLTVVGRPNGYLATRASYRDYVLRFEWRWSGSEVPANSNGGALIHVTSGPVQQKLWPTSFQVQLKIQRAGDILSMGSAKFGEAPTTPGTETSPSSTLARRAESSEKPIGEWNFAEVVVRGRTIAVTINGVLQNEVTDCEPSAGRIGFQLEGQPFQLRNVIVRPIDSPAPARAPFET